MKGKKPDRSEKHPDAERIRGAAAEPDAESPADPPPGPNAEPPAEPVAESDAAHLAEAVADAQPITWAESVDESSGLRSLDRIAMAFRASSALYDAEHPHDPLIARAPAGSGNVVFRWGHLDAFERLGEGSYGEVWRARDTRLDREVALKLRTTPSGASDPETQRFLEEARRLARVRHANVLAVHGADLHDGRVGLWADLVEGETLEQRLTEHGPLGAAEAAVLGADLCRALAAIHGAGLLHGDVKTQNVMRERGGAIVLLDFGSGRRLPEPGSVPAAAVPTGTPLASPPEVLRGEVPDARADVYSLGVLLYRMVTGEYPVPARTLGELMEKHARGESVPLRDARPDLPSDFVHTVERALAASPEDRFASVGEMERALGRSAVTPVADGAGAARRPPQTAPWRHWAVPSLAVVGVLLAVALVTSQFRSAVPASALNVTATLFRADAAQDTPLQTGDPVRVGDQLWLELQTDEPVHVYVLDEDEAGELYVLFPVEGLDLTNPLPPGRLRLPGHFRGSSQDWEITSAGGRETILVVSSRKPLPPIDRELAALPSAAPGPQLAYAALDPAALEQLRGVAGMRPTRERDSDRQGHRLAGLARAFREAGGDSRDLWIREIELRGE